MPDDFLRYIEYLQKHMLSDGWEGLFNSHALCKWTEDHKNEIANLPGIKNSQYRNSLIQALEGLHTDFPPETQFDLSYTHAIFKPILEKVQLSAKRLGLRETRPIHIATSTEISASPMARPTSGGHVLFIGLGTSVFCNYWAKVYTSIVQTLANNSRHTRINSLETFRRVLGNDISDIILASRLFFYYAIHGTLLGFDRVILPESHLPYRGQLLEAMELFVVSHEYAHFVAEERIPDFQGMLDEADSKQLESFCDELGVSLLIESSKEYNYLGFSGVGAIVFFRAMQLCKSIRQTLKQSKTSTNTPLCSSLHPTFEERIEIVKAQVLQTIVADQKDHVKKFIEEYDVIAVSLNSIILEICGRFTEDK